MRLRLPAKNGFTFFELMVTVVILALGISMIYRGLLSALSIQRHMIYRSYAHNLLDHKIASLQFAFQQDAEVPVYEENEIENIVLNNHQVVFRFQSRFSPVLSLPNIQRVDMILSWQERNRGFQLTRSAYLSKF